MDKHIYSKCKKRFQGTSGQKTLTTRFVESMTAGGCDECQTSCQSACKTSCTVGSQSCEEML